MTKPDFSGVEPTRVAEALRRIKTIENYLDIERPGAEQTAAAAESLQLTRWTFARLVKSWRDHRDPTMMVKSRTGPSKRDYGIDVRAKRIAKEEIQKVGFSAELSNVAPAIEAACNKLAIKPPSRPTIYNYILAERREGTLRFDRLPCVVIGRMWFHLPLEETAANAMPCALLGVALPERIVIAHAISASKYSPPSIVKVLSEVLDASNGEGVCKELLLDSVDRAAASSMIAARDLSGIASCKLSLQRLLAQAFGDQISLLQPIYRRGGALVKPKYVMGSHDQSLDADAAVSVIEEAIALSNSARGELGPYSINI